MKFFSQLVEEQSREIEEVMPWDLEEILNQDKKPLILDIREPYEFKAMHIQGSVNVPRGILESACEYDYEETIPELVKARDQTVIVVCRSGNRSVLAAYTMKILGYQNPVSLKTGLRGWNDYELELVNIEQKVVDMDKADDYFDTKLDDDQLDPSRNK